MMQKTSKTYKKFTGGHTKSVNNMEWDKLLMACQIMWKEDNYGENCICS